MWFVVAPPFKYASLETEKDRSRGVMPQKYGYVIKSGAKYLHVKLAKTLWSRGVVYSREVL